MDSMDNIEELIIALKGNGYIIRETNTLYDVYANTSQDMQYSCTKDDLQKIKVIEKYLTKYGSKTMQHINKLI